VHRSVKELMGDDRGTTTVEWLVVSSIAILVAALAARALADRGRTEGTRIETEINNAFSAMLP